jgi:hypothetical protein
MNSNNIKLNFKGLDYFQIFENLDFIKNDQTCNNDYLISIQSNFLKNVTNQVI